MPTTTVPADGGVRSDAPEAGAEADPCPLSLPHPAQRNNAAAQAETPMKCMHLRIIMDAGSLNGPDAGKRRFHFAASNALSHRVMNDT
jgi:hypothetical protein